MSGGGGEKKDGEDEEKDLTALWDFKSFKDSDFWFLKTGKSMLKCEIFE